MRRNEGLYNKLEVKKYILYEGAIHTKVICIDVTESTMKFLREVKAHTYSKLKRKSLKKLSTMQGCTELIMKEIRNVLFNLGDDCIDDMRKKIPIEDHKEFKIIFEGKELSLSEVKNLSTYPRMPWFV